MKVNSRKLPTVRLRQKSSGREIEINQTDYARDLGRWTGWNIIAMKHGNASDAEVLFAKQQTEVEEVRKQNTAHPASKDDKRAWEHTHGAGPVGVTTAKPTAEEKVEAPQPAAPQATEAPAEQGSSLALNPEWKALPWWDRVAHIEAVTGKKPKNQGDAEAIVSEWEAGS